MIYRVTNSEDMEPIESQPIEIVPEDVDNTDEQVDTPQADQSTDVLHNILKEINHG